MILIPPLLTPLALAVGGYYYFAVPAKSTPKGSASQARFKSGQTGVICEKFRLVDETRETQAYNGYTGHHARVLKGEVWRPEAMEEAGPLVVYSHGFMSNRREGLYLIRFLASHGYTVATLDYPLTGSAAPDKPFVPDVINQPGDISYLIDRLLERNEDPGDTLYTTIDRKKIALIGLSLGSLTSMLTTYHRGLCDPRIAAAVCIAGPTNMFTNDFFAGKAIPTLMIHADKDSVVRYEDHAIPTLDMLAEGVLVTLKNASHTGFAQPASTYLRFLKNPDTIACRLFSGKQFDNAEDSFDFASMLGGLEMGVADSDLGRPTKTPLVPVAMKATRQHMFTTLAAHTFLESEFANDASRRRASRQYLLRTLPLENESDVCVSQSSLLGKDYASATTTGRPRRARRNKLKSVA